MPIGAARPSTARWLLRHDSDSAGLLAGRGESDDRQAPLGLTVAACSAPEFMPKRNSELSGNRDRIVDDAARPEIGDLRGRIFDQRSRLLLWRSAFPIAVSMGDLATAGSRSADAIALVDDLESVGWCGTQGCRGPRAGWIWPSHRSW